MVLVLLIKPMNTKDTNPLIVSEISTKDSVSSHPEENYCIVKKPEKIQNTKEGLLLVFDNKLWFT